MMNTNPPLIAKSHIMSRWQKESRSVIEMLSRRWRIDLGTDIGVHQFQGHPATLDVPPHSNPILMIGMLPSMQRTDLLDTRLEVHQMRINLLRQKSPEWRVQKAFELTDQSRQMFPEQTRRALLKQFKVK